MTKSPFSHAAYLLRGILAFAVLSSALGVVFHSDLASRILAQEPIGLATAYAIPDATGAAPAAATPTDVFLELAGSVGLTASAQRLVDYKLKNDPESTQRYYAIVDFDRPSTSKRFYVFDTVERTVNAYYVAHGRGSEGAKDDGIPEVFSNSNGSNSSSLGIYRTLNEYNGHHGRSLRLEGLEPTNSNALSRAVVMHPADYVSESFIGRTGRLGRSQGCFAVEKSVANTLTDQLKDGAYIIASKN